MAIINLPAKFAFTKVNKFGLTRAGNTLRSRYTGQGQRVVYPFAVWELEGTLVDYDGPEAAAIRSFLVQLEGIKNEFRLPVPGWMPSNIHNAKFADFEVYGAGGAPIRASSINARVGGNWQLGAWLDEGSYLQIGDELKIVTAAVASSTDLATINFKPALRKGYAHATPIIVRNPTVLMHAVEDDVASWGLSAPVRHGLSIAAIEAVNI